MIRGFSEAHKASLVAATDKLVSRLLNTAVKPEQAQALQGVVNSLVAAKERLLAVPHNPGLYKPTGIKQEEQPDAVGNEAGENTVVLAMVK